MGESRVWVGVGEGLLPITVMNSLLRMPSDPRAHTGESFKVHFAVDKILNLRFRILDNLSLLLAMGASRYDDNFANFSNSSLKDSLQLLADGGRGC